MWNCLCCIKTFFGRSYDNDEDKISLEREIQFLVYWGKLDRETAIHMPIFKRKIWIDLTIESVKKLYGTDENGAS